MEISDLPVEVLEHIFSFLTTPSDQQKLCRVSWLWRDVVVRMRALTKSTSSTATTFSKFEQRVYVRLPVAGSLNEGHGNEGFAIILSVDSEILLSGLGIFLPSDTSANSPDQLTVRVRLSEHAVSQIGPIGPILCDSESRLRKNEIRFWNSEENCSRFKNETRQSFKCMPGPRQPSDLSRISTCDSIHPYPIFFDQSVILSPGVRYLLSLFMTWEQVLLFSTSY
jgi:hypothetical protein